MFLFNSRLVSDNNVTCTYMHGVVRVQDRDEDIYRSITIAVYGAPKNMKAPRLATVPVEATAAVDLVTIHKCIIV